MQEKMFLIALKAILFPILSDTTSKESFMGETSCQRKGTGLKILTPKQTLQRLPIALAQTKVGNNSESLLNGIRQIVYSLYQSKEITEKVYDNIVKSMRV